MPSRSNNKPPSISTSLLETTSSIPESSVSIPIYWSTSSKYNGTAWSSAGTVTGGAGEHVGGAGTGSSFLATGGSTRNDKCDKYHGETYDAVDYDAIVISDYNKGFLSTKDIEAWIERSTCPIFLDTKKKLGFWCQHADFIKINEHEWEQSKPCNYNNVIVTMGSKGAIYNNKKYPVKSKVKVSNVSGAGDTFVAGLVYNWINSGSIDKAIKFANNCASKVVQERGVTIIT